TTRSDGQAPSSLYPVGVTTVTSVATDSAGGTSSCFFTGTVTDTQNPVISNCPTNITKNTDAGLCTAVATWTAPMATDNCTGVTISQTAGPVSGSAFPKGTTTVTYTATDTSGHTATCSF